MIDTIVKVICAIMCGFTITYTVRTILDGAFDFKNFKNICLIIMISIVILVSYNVNYNAESILLKIVLCAVCFNFLINGSLYKIFIALLITLAIISVCDLANTIVWLNFVSIQEMREVWYYSILCNIIVYILTLMTINNSAMKTKLNTFINNINDKSKISTIFLFTLSMIAIVYTLYNISINSSKNSNYFINIIIMFSYCLIMIIFLREQGEYNDLINKYDSLFDYFKEIEDIIRANFPTKIFKKITIPCRLEEKNSRSKKLIKLEENDSNQSKLAVGCRLVGLTDYERNYALTIYNIILGGGTDSKLFKEVREAHSMAYYISSVVNKLDNIMLIRAGITRDNFDSVVKLIEQEMNEMKKGKFLDDDIAKAKQIYLSAIDEIEESQSDIIDSYYMMDLLGVDDIETKKKKMMLVSRDDIIKVSKKVFIDTIYMLEGVKE